MGSARVLAPPGLLAFHWGVSRLTDPDCHGFPRVRAHSKTLQPLLSRNYRRRRTLSCCLLAVRVGGVVFSPLTK